MSCLQHHALAGTSLRLRSVLTLCLSTLLITACGGANAPDDAAAPVVPVIPVAPVVPVVPVPTPDPVAGVLTVLPARLALRPGDDTDLLVLRAAGALTWTSSDPAVAGVDSAGRVTALSAGTATLSATAGTQHSSVSVRVHASGAATSGALIAAALASGSLNAEQALIYRVYARFGDARLPAAYDGAPATAPSHLLMREAAGKLATLSAAGQDILRPFLLPPIYAESWAAQQMGLSAPAAQGRAMAATAGRLGASVNCRVAAHPTGWLLKTTAHFNIHYPDVRPFEATHGNIAEAVASVAEAVYASMTGVLQRFPMSDASLPCNGGDGALDIYLDYFMPASDFAATTTYGACQADPSYISINASHPFFRREVGLRPTDATVLRGVKAVLAHEMTHVLQFTQTRQAACDDYAWLDEATAEWAMDHVDTGFDRFEDGYTKLTSAGRRTGGFLLRYLAHDHLRSVEKPGSDEGPNEHGYAEYLFAQFIARRYGSDTMRQIHDAQGTHASVEAVEAALAAQGGFKAVWPEFALTLWLGRAEHVLDYWSGVDRYDYGLANIYQPAGGDAFAGAQGRLRSLSVDQLGQPRASFKLLGNALAFASGHYEIEARSLHYEHLKFSDATVHSVMLINPIAILPEHGHMKLQAVKKIGGLWQAVEDWTEDSTRSFCLDQKDQRVEELLLIVSNSRVDRAADEPFRIPELFPMRLSTSNVGCWRWEGTASTTSTYDDGSLSGQSTGSGVVRWDVAAALPGSVQFEPRAGFIDGISSGRLGQCSFAETAERKVLDASSSGDGRLYVSLDLDLGFGEAPTRELTAFDGGASVLATRTMTCPTGVVASTGLTNYTWLQVDDAVTYAVSADGQTLEGQYIANFPLTRSSITTRFRFTAQRE